MPVTIWSNNPAAVAGGSDLSRFESMSLNSNSEEWTRVVSFDMRRSSRCSPFRVEFAVQKPPGNANNYLSINILNNEKRQKCIFLRAVATLSFKQSNLMSICSTMFKRLLYFVIKQGLSRSVLKQHSIFNIYSSLCTGIRGKKASISCLFKDKIFSKTYRQLTI